MLPVNFDKLKQTGKEIEQELASILRRIGATLGEYSVEVVDINISEEELLEFAKSNPGAPIILKDKFCLAYIKDHTLCYKDTHQREVHAHPNGCFVRGGNRVHFYYCITLMQMSERGRRRRYRCADADRMGNYQKIDLKDANDVYTRLAWCQNCIEELANSSKVKQQLRWRPWRIFQWKYKKRIAQYGDANGLMECVRLSYELSPDATQKTKAFFENVSI